MDAANVIQMPLPGLALHRPDKPCPACAGMGTLEATDIFCGAGGSSLGLEFVCCPSCGRSLIRVTQAINHWDLAVQAHNANFPHADHDVHDVEEIAASRFRRTEVLWASPECTHHAYCRGPKELGDDAIRSRATFADIIRFTRHHKYDAVIVENVVEARLWCDERGHREKCSCGRTFDRWFQAIAELGYEGQIVYFNSQFALPTPQSRDRMYVVFWRRGARRPDLDFRPMSWCSSCETVVQGVQAWKAPSRGGVRTQDGMHEWGRYGQQYLYRCPRCTEPVAPAVTGAKTIIDWGLPSQRIGERSKPLAVKTRARIKTGLERLATSRPVTVQVGGNLYERQGYARVWSVDEPLRTVTGTRSTGLVTPAGGQKAAARSIEEPAHTVLGNDRLAVVLRAGGQAAAPVATGEPMRAVIGSDRQLAIVQPNMEHCVGGSTDEPVGAVTTGNRHMLVQVNRGAKAGKDSRSAQTVSEPTRTISGHGELALVTLRANGGARSAEEPAAALAASGTHHGLLVYNGVPGFVRDLGDAAGTVTGRDKQSLLVPYYSTGVARSTGEPSATVSTKDREALVITDDDIDACQFRMLQWQELLRAQMMHTLPDGSDYLLTARRRDKRGRVRELSNELRVKMIGNAVSSPVATMLGWAITDALR